MAVCGENKLVVAGRGQVSDEGFRVVTIDYIRGAKCRRGS